MIINEPKDICPILKTIRQSIGMSQDDLSINSGVSKGTISSIELGRRIPSLETTFAILRSFGYSVHLEIKPHRIAVSSGNIVNNF